MGGRSALAVCTFALAACGLGVVGSAGETATSNQTGGHDGGATSSGDAAQDGDTAPVLGSSSGGTPGMPGDAGGDAGFDSGPAPLLYDCPGGAPVTSCGSCSGHPTGCIFCNALGGASLKGTCLQASQACYYNVPAGWTVCRCTPPSASACPARTNQVCNTFDNGYCQPCGDMYSDGFACRGGGSCTQASATCN